MTYDLICLSHLRWDFVYQRPQHLLSRFARERRVFFVEEPVFSDCAAPHLEISRREDKLFVVRPHINHGEAAQQASEILQRMIDELLRAERIEDYVVWYYTPMALEFSGRLKPKAVIYDIMDELSLFKFAPPTLLSNEEKLLEMSDAVFTGGQSLYEAKRHRHENIHAFPSSIDTEHFKQARAITGDAPADQAEIPHPRLGFIGVIDERMDLDLLKECAATRPDWQFVMIGPVVKIAEEDLPRAANIHYLGKKDYDELPAYIAGWDAALMPFAINDSTRFISPTKTPEYLAAGKPVVSTAIRDVVRPYGENGFVHIASTPAEFVAAIENALNENAEERLKKVDEFLSGNSWDNTFRAMANVVDEAVAKQGKAAASSS